MLSRLKDQPEHALALSASGTVLARDVEAAVDAALGTGTVGTGLVVVVDEDFDGYFAEVARGLATVSVAHKNIVRIAVVMDSGRLDEAKLGEWSLSAVPVRLFSADERPAAYAWADAVRRGE
jgi:hypothetical protein